MAAPSSPLPHSPAPAESRDLLPFPVDLVVQSQDALMCHSPTRRRITDQRGLFGIDTVEVEDRTLCVRFFGAIPEDLAIKNVRIEGGRRIRNLKVVSITPRPSGDPDVDSCLSVVVDREGDFSPYTIKIGDPKEHGVFRVRNGFDPRYSAAAFSFHPDCPRDTDCAADPVCAPPVRVEPLLDYRAKDYASFRRMILDRWSLILPEWKERHLPDTGIVLVELLAYVGDYLSYYQDAVATEAYLETARQRISVRRHARLVDYVLHEGSNARALVCLKSETDVDLKPDEFFFATQTPELQQSGRAVWSNEGIQAFLPQMTIFEPMGTAPIRVRAYHSEIYFYTWGDSECFLRKGATQATLWDPAKDTSDDNSSATQRALDLRVGDLLILEEIKGAHTGNEADADPAHRHPVRLTSVTPGIDPVLQENVVEIEWALVDALPFALCLSSRQKAVSSNRVDGASGPLVCKAISDVSVARGNVVLADHGRLVSDDFEPVSTQNATYVCRCDGSIADEERTAGLFAPELPRAPLTHAELAPAPHSPAAELMPQKPYRAVPQITLTSTKNEETEETVVWRGGPCSWQARPDLLQSAPRDTHFVVETDNDNKAHLRFGDGLNGQKPEAGFAFTAQYRIGNGTCGNIGAEMLCILVFRQKENEYKGDSIRPRNPLPARGGTEPEPIASAKRFAPDAFRAKKRRAVIPDDFAQFAQQNSHVQKAASDLRWTGSWFEARTAIDALAKSGDDLADDTALLRELETVFASVRRIGWDATAVSARRVPIALTLSVCIRPDYVAAQVAGALKAAFGSGILPNNTLGFFHPDNLTLGQSIAISRIIAVAQAVPGVLSSEVTELSRQNEPAQNELEDGVLRLATDEVAELANDPNHPERGLLRIQTKGGR